jgi:hypothetical protein
MRITIDVELVGALRQEAIIVVYRRSSGGPLFIGKSLIIFGKDRSITPPIIPYNSEKTLSGSVILSLRKRIRCFSHLCVSDDMRITVDVELEGALR